MADQIAGNVLGAARAEADLRMLDSAFIETADFKALLETQDFNFVVGRRGTGKSALHLKLTRRLHGGGVICLSDRPEEFEVLEAQTYLADTTDSYRTMRSMLRVAWRAHLLLWVLAELIDHYKLAGKESGKDVAHHAQVHARILRHNSPGRVAGILAAAIDATDNNPQRVPGAIATRFALSSLEDVIRQALADINRPALIFLDGLDEGWTPDVGATAVLGGLAAAVSDLDERKVGVHGTLFVRDNMFRALAHFDQDFSRHIEGNALRLHWDKASLFELVCGRLRIALNLEDVEASEKVWNAFVDDSLKGREKFEECLRLTLYRPRDILILLNRGYVIGRRRGARHLRAQDIEAAATEISNDRLDDLIKEYDSVLPGLRSFVRLFEGAPASMPIGTVDELLDEEIQSGAYQAEWDSDFALLGTGRHVADALYGVGFLGLEDRRRERVVFCHDGSGTEVEELEEKDRMVVHPCYWRALEVKAPDEAEQLTVEISDEFDSLKGSDLGDIRFRRLGQVISELPGIAVGTDGSGQFEQWVLRAVKILFAGKLANPELHPAPDAIQRRDVVATNEAERGIWKRVREDYGSRQVIFEVKNYEDLRMDDFRQVLSYTSGEYGRFAVICHRGDAEGVGSKERGWLQTMYHEHQRLILTIPDIILRRSISKLRNVDRHDYVEHQLGKRLDTFVRSYLSLKHVERYRPKKRRRKSGG